MTKEKTGILYAYWHLWCIVELQPDFMKSSEANGESAELVLLSDKRFLSFIILLIIISERASVD